MVMTFTFENKGSILILSSVEEQIWTAMVDCSSNIAQAILKLCIKSPSLWVSVCPLISADTIGFMSDQLFSLSPLGNSKEIMVGWEKVAAL
jgi:hypothetical protein